MGEIEHSIVLLRTILENLDQPENLNDHPWAKSPMVAEICKRIPGSCDLTPGEQLVQTINSLFRLTMPSTPPRRGVRLDSHWGEFGILASQYFAPLEFNLPYPASLREAWQNIDRAILLFVFKNNENVSDQNRYNYQLIGDEPEVAPNSTISDWHRKGIEEFSNFIMQYMKQAEIRSKISESSQNNGSRFKQFLNKLKPPRLFWVWFRRIFLFLIISLLAAASFKSWDLYQKTISLKKQADEIIVLYNISSEKDRIPEIVRKVSQFRLDLEALQKEISPLLGASHYFTWVPVYGGDISQAPILVDMVVQMSIASDEVLRAVSPILAANSDGSSSAGILDQVSLLKDADTQLLAAQVAFAKAMAARQKIQTDILSPKVNQIIIERIDPLIASINSAFPVSDILQMARLAPRLLGAVGNGKQSYMILIQNEDELRPTGGFLTAVGLMEIENGKILNISFESSERVDDPNKPYPKSPRQLDDYMMAEILVFRDSNWFTDFPTTVEWAKFLYSYTRSKEVDGVITVDQHVVQELLKIVGPVEVVGVEEPISTGNVLTYMRTAKENRAPAGVSQQDWDRKQFVGWLADPLIKKLLSVNSDSWRSLSEILIQLMDEKHILLHFNDPEMSTLISKRGWDGTVKTAMNSDFLMVVDSNVGFNKTNALMESEINYAVNLADLNRPTAKLEIEFTNNSRITSETSTECIQFGGDIRGLPLDQRDYTLDDCYWTYLRVYTPAESQLLSSTPQEIPQGWPLRENLPPAQTDILDEDIAETQIFGTLMVVPEGQSQKTTFEYQLPASVLTSDTQSNAYRYRLKFQKQPGTQEVPLTLNLVFPPGTTITDAPPGLTQDPNSKGWVLATDLRLDVMFEVGFQVDN